MSASAADRAFGGAAEVEPLGAEVRGQPARLGTERRDRERDRVVGVDEAEVGVEESDLAARAFGLPLDGLVAQERLHHAQVLTQVGELDRGQAHGAPPGEPGADAELDAARRQPVEGGEAVGRHRRDAVRRDEDAGREPDARGALGGQRHADEDVRVQELRVVEPGFVEAQLFGARHHAPGFRRRCDRDAELHGGGLSHLNRRDRAAPSRPRAPRSGRCNRTRRGPRRRGR